MSLPNISKAIDIPEDQLQWLISAYSLSSVSPYSQRSCPILTLSQGCLLLFFGRLADLYGRKKAFLLGMSWQMAFAIGLGFAESESPA